VIDSGFLYPPPPFGCEDYFRQDRRWCKLRKSENCPSKRHFVTILRAWYPNVHLQRETCCGSQNSLQQLARKFANVFLCRRRFICNHSGFNAVYVEPRWRPSTVDSEQLWEALTQGGFEAGSPFCFWIKSSDFILGPPRLFSLWRASQKACWTQLMICVLTCFVFARHYGTVSRNHKLVFGSRWLVWENHSRNEFHDCSGCMSKSRLDVPREGEGTRENACQNTKISVLTFIASHCS
jgi:hypothetical protein